MLLLFLLLLGAGLSLLLTELSTGLGSENSRLVVAGMFIGYCAALLVGSHSHLQHFLFVYWPHPQILAVAVYWVIVAIGAGLAHSSVD